MQGENRRTICPTVEDLSSIIFKLAGFYLTTLTSHSKPPSQSVTDIRKKKIFLHPSFPRGPASIFLELLLTSYTLHNNTSHTKRHLRRRVSSLHSKLIVIQVISSLLSRPRLLSPIYPFLISLHYTSTNHGHLRLYPLAMHAGRLCNPWSPVSC